MPLFEQHDRRVGFTGTQIGMLSSQRWALETKLTLLKAEGYNWFHHGNCIGADEQAAMIAKRLGYKLYAHPSNIKKKQASIWNDFTANARDPLARNRDIVDRVLLVIAAPETREEQLRSGTWATIRYARSVNVPLEILNP